MEPASKASGKRAPTEVTSVSLVTVEWSTTCVCTEG
jgi:hypothetical protein